MKRWTDAADRWMNRQTDEQTEGLTDKRLIA